MKPARATARIYPPRNAPAVQRMRDGGRLRPGDTVIVSFVGQTDFPYPHVFVEPSTDYDMRVISGLHVVIAVRPGIDCSRVMREVFNLADVFKGYPTVADVERKQVGCLVGVNPLKLWTIKQDSQLWRQHFA